MSMILRLLLLNVVPALWLLLIVQSASQNVRTQPVHWLALPVAIAFAYVAFSFTFALGPLPISPLLIALSVVALAASIAAEIIHRSAADGVTTVLLVTTYLVWLTAFGGAVVSQWFRPNVPWPLTGNIDVAIVHVLMIVPLAVLLIAFLVSMASGG